MCSFRGYIEDFVNVCYLSIFKDIQKVYKDMILCINKDDNIQKSKKGEVSITE